MLQSTQSKTNFFSYVASKENNFDSLRFLFAFIVLLVHAHVLSGSGSLAVLSGVLSSEIAVKSFFVVSGFLIFMSFERSSSTKSYFSKRVKRIYPAYVFIILVAACFGLFLSTFGWTDYFSFQLLKYLLSNLIFLNFLQPNLPGVFDSNLLQAVNGALWTLKVEVMFYLSVPVVVFLFNRYGRLKVMLAIYLLSILYSVANILLANKTGLSIFTVFQRQLPGQLTYFISGAFAYYYFQFLSKHIRWILGLALAALVLRGWLPWIIIEPLVLAVIVIYFACIFPCLGRFGKYGDFSYGIYIVHFPIIQVMVYLGYFKSSPWVSLCLAALIIISLAFLLWHLVEKRFLAKTSYYATTAKGS